MQWVENSIYDIPTVSIAGGRKEEPGLSLRMNFLLQLLNITVRSFKCTVGTL